MKGKIAQKNDVAVQECRGPGAPRKVVNKPSKHKKLFSFKFKFHYFRDQHINMALSPFVRSQQQNFKMVSISKISSFHLPARASQVMPVMVKGGIRLPLLPHGDVQVELLTHHPAPLQQLQQLVTYF